jgi:hypothetical protein
VGSPSKTVLSAPSKSAILLSATVDAGFDQPRAVADISPARRDGCRFVWHASVMPSRVDIRQASNMFLFLI